MKTEETDEVEDVEIVDDLAGNPEDRMIPVCCPYGFSKDDPPMGYEKNPPQR